MSYSRAEYRCDICGKTADGDLTPEGWTFGNETRPQDDYSEDWCGPCSKERAAKGNGGKQR